MQADLGGAMEIIRVAKDFDWEWSIDDVMRFSAAVGWQVSYPDPNRPQPSTNLKIASPLVSVESGNKGRELRRVSFYVADFAESDTPVPPEVGLDCFAEFSRRLIAELGTPTRRNPGPMPELGWDLPQLVVFLKGDDDVTAIEFVDPKFQKWWDSDFVPAPRRDVR